MPEPDQQDQLTARRVANAVAALNTAIVDAARHGLDVHVDTFYPKEIFDEQDDREIPQVQVQVSQTTMLAVEPGGEE